MADLTFTTIEESARRKLGITRDDYALCNYIQTWSSHPKNKKIGFCDRTRGQMADFIGITPRGIIKMLTRLNGLGLVEPCESFLYRTTSKWFDVVLMAKDERKGEQSSGVGVNKVQGGGEQSSGVGVNKVQTHKEYNKEPNKERENAPENSVFSSTLEEGEKTPPPIPAAPPSWRDRPNTDTPVRMFDDLAKFYAVYNEDWRLLLDSAGATYDLRERREIMLSFCSYQIENNRTANTYRQTHAALQRWFIGQKAMRKPAAQKSTISKTAGSDVEHYRKPQAF